MSELLVDFITSLDGYGAAEGWPGWWGLEGPEYLAWLGEHPESLLGSALLVWMLGQIATALTARAERRQRLRRAAVALRTEIELIRENLERFIPGYADLAERMRAEPQRRFFILANRRSQQTFETLRPDLVAMPSEVLKAVVKFYTLDAEINQFMRQLSTEIILENPAHYLSGTATMTWQLLAGEPEKLSTDWKTQNARLSREEWDDRVEHLLSRASTPQRNELDNASAIVALVQPPAWHPLMPVLFPPFAGDVFAIPGQRDLLLLLTLALACTLLPFALSFVALRHMSAFAAQLAVFEGSR